MACWQSKKLHLELVKNQVTSHNTSFLYKSDITYKEVKKKTSKAISALKEDRQALGLLVSKYADKKAAFHYPLTLHSLGIADPNGKLY